MFSDVTPSVPINSNISYHHNTHYLPVKKIYIYPVLMDREIDSMSIVLYSVDPQYSEEKINNRQHFITKTTAQPFPFSIRLQNNNNPHNVWT